MESDLTMVLWEWDQTYMGSVGVPLLIRLLCYGKSWGIPLHGPSQSPGGLDMEINEPPM